MFKSWIIPTKLLLSAGYFSPVDCVTIFQRGNENVKPVSAPYNHGQQIEKELEHMSSKENFQTVSDIFKQLCDESRIRIFWLLCHCEECVINLVALEGMTSPAVSHHLRQLKSRGLIVSRRDGKEVYYRAADTEQAQILHHMIEKMVEIFCPSAIYIAEGGET